MTNIKISFIGSGAVASSTAFISGINKICNEIVLLDINEDFAKGKAIDLQQSFILNGKNISVIGCNDYSKIKGSDAIVITAGAVHKNGYQDRETLLDTNRKIIRQIAGDLRSVIPTDEKQPLIIMVTNPLDAILKEFIDFGGFYRRKTVGSGNLLDATRFKYYLSKELNISADRIETVAMCQHGLQIVYLLSKTTVDGVPLFDYIKKDANISSEKIAEICNTATNGGGTIVNLLQKESTVFGPAVSIFNVLKCHLNDEKKTLPVSLYCNGEYGVENICMGCPAVMGKDGVEKVIEYDITEEEKTKIREAANFIDKLNKK
ncbi:MAG: hypothetical protein IJ853_04080 [Rickettsiales bacterium]|nr:hypothetical protein [Rickettsiales bacterium]